MGGGDGDAVCVCTGVWVSIGVPVPKVDTYELGVIAEVGDGCGCECVNDDVFV
jgi:hypothetical protein